MLEIIREIGSYAGFAAVVGLAALSALYFSQARDVKRLREWAGRAPERAAQAEAEAAARAAAAAQAQRPGAAAAAQRPAAAQAGARPAAAPGSAVPGAAAASAGATVGTGQPATAAGGATTAAAGTATAAGGARPGGNGAPPRPAAGVGPAIPRPAAAAPRPGAQTAILTPSIRPRAPWYRRIAPPQPRYLALIVAGVLVLGGGAAYGIAQLTGGGGTQNATSRTPSAGGGSQGAKARPAPVNPAEVTVSVLNGTSVTGLAADIMDKLVAAGFQRGNTDNALDQAKAESVVLYARGARREAKAVADRLGITQIEPIDPDSQLRGGNASVVVIVGADQTL